MKAIETEYKGYRFRSRLEARWAVFFDACGVKWEYEPEGFDLGDGLYYLPDFLLHNVFIRDCDTPCDLWVEVKGQMTEADAQKIIKFVNEQETFDDDGVMNGYAMDNSILIVTSIPDGNDFWELIDYMRDLAYGNGETPPFNLHTIDGDWFACFPTITKQGRFCLMDDNGRCVDKADEKATKEAYRLARQARFEHKRTKNSPIFGGRYENQISRP